LFGALRLALAFVRLAGHIDVVNLHGFSRKAMLLVALSRLFGKPFILTLQTGAQDEPATVQAMGRLAYWAYQHADLYLSVSPGLSRAYLDAGLPGARLRQVCNAVDVDRFKPADVEERRSLRAELRLPQEIPLVLFVGVFSRDKRPHILYRAWAQVGAAGLRTAIVFIGATRPVNQDIDARLGDEIRDRAVADGLVGDVFFVESSHTIEKYFRAVDIYVLPSIREGLPIALLEAMSSALPCVASRLPGSTDVLIEDGINGLLVRPDDVDGIAAAIESLARDRGRAARLGAAARRTVLDRYSIQRTAAEWLTAYREVAGYRGKVTRHPELT
jgi:glycosyltransferase involved in cell wall biosynthesis